MRLEVFICPDQNRIDGQYNHPLEGQVRAALERGQDKPIPDRFIVTCYEDVAEWGDANYRRMYPGMHWYGINIGEPDGELMHFEMPRGDMMPQDRLWPIIELYAAFYRGIP